MNPAMNPLPETRRLYASRIITHMLSHLLSGQLWGFSGGVIWSFVPTTRPSYTVISYNTLNPKP